MNIIFWTLQIILGIFFTLHGAALAAWAAPLRDALSISPYPKGFLQFIGLCELLGGLGLILPWWLGVAPVLTPLAAGLTLIMLGAVITHLQANETPQIVMNSTIVALLILVTLARW